MGQNLIAATADITVNDKNSYPTIDREPPTIGIKGKSRAWRGSGKTVAKYTAWIRLRRGENRPSG